MHTRKYIFKDGGISSPTTSAGLIHMRVILPGEENYTAVDTSGYDFISYEYFFGPNESSSPNVLNTLNIKIGVTLRRKSDGKIFTGVSTGINLVYSNGLYPVLKEV